MMMLKDTACPRRVVSIHFRRRCMDMEDQRLLLRPRKSCSLRPFDSFPVPHSARSTTLFDRQRRDPDRKTSGRSSSIRRMCIECERDVAIVIAIVFTKWCLYTKHVTYSITTPQSRSTSSVLIRSHSLPRTRTWKRISFLLPSSDLSTHRPPGTEGERWVRTRIFFVQRHGGSDDHWRAWSGG